MTTRRAFVLTALLVGCDATDPRATADTEATQAVYAAVLALQVERGSSLSPVVVRRAFASPVIAESEQALRQSQRAFVARLVSEGVPRSLASKLLEVQGGELDAALLSRAPMPVQIDSTLSDIRGNETPDELRVYSDSLMALSTRLPGLRLVRLSPVTFTPRGDEAAVYVGMFCGPLCGQSAVYVLRRDAANWKVTRMVLLSVS